MARTRKAENRGLPARWRLTHGAYFYQVPPGLEALWDGKKTFRLGKTLPEAYGVWAGRIGSQDKARNIGQLLDRYVLEVVPTKAKTTRSGNLVFIKTLRATFGLVPLAAIRPKHIYQYVDKRSAKVSAHREVEVLSHAFTKAVQWGYLDRHPFRGEVRLDGEKPRTRYVEDWEMVEALTLKPTRQSGSVLMIQAYMRIKLLTGLRRGDILRLKMSDLQDDGIHVTPSKTKNTTSKRLVYDWTSELRAATDEARSVRPVLSPFLFCTRRGECYVKEDDTANGWDSLWQRFMARLLVETKITQRFTEHDLRAKCASDATTVEHAQQLLAHADSSTTRRIYRRKIEHVKPLR